jgi:hypothetical protein
MHLLAYIDPGSGSLFIQAVIATAMVVPFFLRSQIRKGINRLRGHPSDDNSSVVVAPHPGTSSPPDDVLPPTQP